MISPLNALHMKASDSCKIQVKSFTRLKKSRENFHGPFETKKKTVAWVAMVLWCFANYKLLNQVPVADP